MACKVSLKIGSKSLQEYFERIFETPRFHDASRVTKRCAVMTSEAEIGESRQTIVYDVTIMRQEAKNIMRNLR